MAVEDKKTTQTPHSLILENRKSLTATGVSNVDSFDEQMVVAYTDLGELVIKGSNLNINSLSIETGELTLTGEISSMTYNADTRPSGGLLSRIFR